MVRGATHPAAASAPAIPPQPQHPARPSSDFWTQPPIQRPMRGLWRIETQATTCNGTESGNKAASLDGPPSTAVPPRADWPPTPPLSSSASKTIFTSGNGTGGSYSPSTQQQQRHSSQRSKNDIFEHPSPVLTPPKPPPALPPMMAAHASLDSAPAPASPSTGPKSRNSLFFETPSSSPSFAVWRGTWQPNADVTASPTLASASSRQPPPTPPLPQHPSASTSASTWDESRPLYTSTSLSRDTQRPSLGRLSSEEQQRERDRIRGASKEIDFRLTPSKQNLLGEGRHCNVYLGAYRKRGGAGGRVGEWQLCAIKRLHADRQSQLLGLDEGFALRRIGRHPGIVALIDIRDEVMAPTPAPTTSTSSTLGLGRPPSNSVSLHGRSTSAAQQQAQGRGAAGRTQQHMRLASQPVGHAQTPQVRISGQDGSSIDEWSNRSDDEDDCPSSASALAEQQQQQQQQAAAEAASIPPSISTDPPRLLILLELLPHSLAAYSRRHSNSITLDFWMRTALDLSATIEYVHSRGCVHADIKPENVLLDDEGRTKLCDFNSAFFPSAASAPLTDGLGLGTPAYGAPELTRRGGSSSGGQKAVVSYPVDIFSLGAVLYGLATGVEPMSRARSAVDMLHRKEHFFATEENDRLTRVAIGKGWASSSSSNGGGGTGASRRSSTRSKRATKAGPRGSANGSSFDSGSPPARRSSLRRQGSTDSMSTSADGSKRSSLASSVTTIAGQKPSMAAVEALLHPGDEAGVLPVPEGSGRGHRYVNAAAAAAAGQAIKAATNQEGNQHHRASSLNKNKQQDPREVDMTADASSARPAWLRRTTSYGGPETVSASSADMNPSTSFQANSLLSPPTSPNHRLLPSAHINAGSELAAHSLQQRLFKQQIPHGRSHARTPSLDSTASSSSLSTSHTAPGDDGESDVDSTTDPSQDGNGQEEDEEGPDDTPYIDGSPALLLPGGGRLPQSALDLLEQMLLPDPRKRPGVAEVRRRLELVEREVYEYAEGEKGP